MSQSQGPEPVDAVFEPLNLEQRHSAVGLNSFAGGSSDSDLSVTAQALMTNEAVIMSDTTTAFSEPAAVAYRSDSSSGSKWSMHMFVNQFPITGANMNRIVHACTTNYANPWCLRYHPVGTPLGVDPSAAYEINGWKILHFLMINPAGTGLSWYYIHDDPCPSVCATQTWTQCSVSPPGITAVDYPQFLYNRITDTKWVVWTVTKSGLNPQIAVTRLDSCTAATHFYPPCAFWGLAPIQFARGAFDSNGDLHIVAFNFSANEVYPTTFHPSTQAWDCNYNFIRSYVQAKGTSTLCPGTRTYQQISDSLRENFSANMAIDDISTPNVLMVTMASGDPTFEARAFTYRSIDNRVTWSLRSQSTQNAYHPQVAFYRTPVSGTAGLFHMTQVWDLSSQPASFAKTASAFSTDGGLLWYSQGISAQRWIVPIAGQGCYWGDYEAIAPDTGHDGVFYGWNDNAAISGRIMNK